MKKEIKAGRKKKISRNHKIFTILAGAVFLVLMGFLIFISDRQIITGAQIDEFAEPAFADADFADSSLIDASLIDDWLAGINFADIAFADNGSLVQTLDGCGNLTTENAAYNMNQSISSSATCLHVMANNVTINCQGNTISYSESAVGYAVNSSNYNLTNVRDCVIAAPTKTTTFKHAIYYYKSSNGTIFNNTITVNPEDSSYGIYLETLSNFNTISNNTITTNNDHGHGIFLNANSSFNTLSNNIITTTGESSTTAGYGIYLNANSDFNILSNNTIRVTTVATGQFAAGIYLSSSTNNTLIGNKANTSSTNSYVLVGTISSHFNNSIDSSNWAEGLPVNYTYNADGLVFNNVDFTQYGQVIFSWSRNIIINSSNFSSDSLSLFNTNTSTISNNRINLDKGIGIWLYDSSINNISNNNITNSNTNGKGYGIYLRSSSNSNIISNNTINNNASLSRYSYGIYLHSVQRNNIVSNNTIRTLAQDAIGIYLLSALNNTLDSNNITTSGSSGYGIYLSTGSNNNSLNNNTITTSGVEAYGIYLFLSSTNNNLTNNKATTNQTNSYVLSGSSNNSIDSSNLAEGLPVNYTCDADNLVFNYTDFTSYGQVIFCNGKNITITNSNFSGDSLNLFNINSSIISNNIINASKGYGIFLLTGSNNNSLNNNTITTFGGLGYGIHLLSSSNNNNAINNIINTNGSSGYGIYLKSSSNNNNLNNNTITTWGGSGYGIHLDTNPSSNIISNNTITTWGGSGYGIILQLSSTNNNLNNNTITTWGSSGYGVYLSSSSNNNATNSIINTNGSSGYGMYFLSSSNNNITNSIINTLGGSGYGILLASNTSNTFSGMSVKTDGTSVYAFYITNGNHNFTISDSMLNASNAWEYSTSALVTGGIWNFTNVTRASGSPITINWGTNINGTLNMHWYLDVNVSSGITSLENANVTSYNNKSALAFSNLTASNGRITKKTLLEYTRNETGGTNYTWNSPYNLSVTLSGYSSYYNSSINLSNNVFMNIDLGCGCPASGDWIVNDNCTLANFTCNMPNYRVSCTGTGSLTMSNYTIIADKVITPINHGCLFMDNRSRVFVGS